MPRLCAMSLSRWSFDPSGYCPLRIISMILLLDVGSLLSKERSLLKVAMIQVRQGPT